jgi:predicted enzyme related to lactoylglutathione lyase
MPGQPYVNGELVVVLDCADLERSATFWSAVLGYEWEGDVVGLYTSLTPPGGGARLLLQRVPEQKQQSKNRLHLDLRTPDLDAEMERVRALGAVQLTEEPLVEHGWTWHVLADPDGNEFCVLQPPRG